MIAGVSDAVIRGLIKAGALEAAEVSVDTPFRPPDPDFAPPELNDAQEAAASELIHAVRARDFKPFLLETRKSVVEETSVSVRVDLGGCRISQKKTEKHKQR